MNHFIRWTGSAHLAARTAAAVLLAGAFPLSARADEASTKQGEAIICDALKAATEKLKSGTGSGFYEARYQMAPGQPWKTVARGKVDVQFSGGKYNVHLKYETDTQFGADARGIVYDGKVLSTVRHYLTPRRMSQGEIFKVQGDRTSAQPAAFPYDPARLPLFNMRPDVFTRLRPPHLDIVRLPDGSLQGPFTRNDGIVWKFHAAAALGHHIDRDEVLVKGVKTQENIVDWASDRGVWYVKGVKQIYRNLQGHGEEKVFHYDQFEPNAAVEDSRFEFKALGLPAGSHILDRTGDDGLVRWTTYKPQ